MNILTNSSHRTLISSLLLCLSMIATPASYADRDGYSAGVEFLINISSQYLDLNGRQHAGHRNTHTESSRDDHQQYRRNDDRGNSHTAAYSRNFGGEARRHFGFASYTSPPFRGGSSRRTRVIENPYSNRIVTGITLTGIDNHAVHIEDVISYPGRYLLSPLGYSLSQYHPPRYINTGHFIDYISVQAKRKEYFTVTFHYD